MRAKFTNCGLVLALAAFGLPLMVEAQPEALEQRVDRYLEPYLEIGHLSGTLLIAREGEVVYEKSFGLADREHAVANTPGTKFCVGSINKPMTIVILARLLEAEKLALTDELGKFLPEFPRADEITVGDLLRHSAGIPHRVTGALDETRPQTPASMVELAAGKELIFDPGTDSVYSSAGFSVLARVLELAGGESYADLLAEHVLRPSGMTDTSDAGTRAIMERRAASYYFDTNGFVNAPPSDASYLVGAGSVFSTPRDLFSMQQALLAGKLGERAQELLVREGGGLRWNGLAMGYRAFADHHAESGVTVVLAGNVTSGALDKIRAAVPKIAAGEDVATPAPIRARATDVDLATLESYQGDYELRPGRNLELRVRNGRVMMGDWLLIPTSERTLFSPQDYAEIEVVVGENGEVERLDWKIGEEIYPLPKVESPAVDEPANEVTEYSGARLFTGSEFLESSLCTSGGVVVACPDTPQVRIDLEGGYLIPPFGDAHTHHFDGTYTFGWHRKIYLESGVFYAMSVTAPSSGVEKIRDRFSGPKDVEVVTALGGITGPDSHPAEIYEALALGIRGYEEQLARAAEIRASKRAANDAYFVVETEADLKEKWPLILGNDPDLIKVYLRNSDLYDDGFGKWGPGGGLDPRLLPLIRAKSEEAGLRLGVANSSLADFRASLEARADLVTHLPCYQDSMSDPSSPYFDTDSAEECELSKADADAAAAIGMGSVLITSEWAKQRPEAYLDWERHNISLLESADAPLAIGSNAYGSTVIDGLIAAAEKRFFEPARLLRLATTDTVRLIFPDRRAGCLEPGCEASFLVLEGDPLEEFSEIRNIRLRVKDGRPLAQDEIDAD